ncbi:long-chain-fatty-acid--CoA ligase [Streptoalloteichus hindustanus]|uniref:Fatty-acyl-CoA synthase n=1 Tax=Streptoalloteichus hindustanus TaxID=2017 RepID=A0A1M5CT49_STRHI|nr:long-chain-fatty-acid--CoA ligase [Streptoalloteichus hindustanus]SHF57924.1 fatty-acyl-CoA synthase [Streptoalloteichus hindustanus]
MYSTMPDIPLTLVRVLRHGATVQGASTVSTWNGRSFDRRSYAEVGERTARLAHALRTRLGVRTGTRPESEQSVVGTFMWNNARHLELFLTVPAMGAVLHTHNLRMPAAQLIYTIRHAGDEVIVVDAGLTGTLATVLPHLPDTVRHIVVAGRGGRAALAGFTGEVHDYEELIADQPVDYPWEEELDEHTAATICYTSGTTGNPKGIVYSHRSTYLHCLQVAAPNRFDLTHRETIFPIAPMFHVNAWNIPHTAFLTGADLLLADRYLQPVPLAHMIELGRPTAAAAVPTVWTGLLAELDARPYDTSSLRRGLVGGSACPPALMAAYRDRHSIELVHAWGMTETSSLTTTALPPRRVDSEEEWSYRISQGQFPASIRFRLVDDDGVIVPNNGVATGELQVRGPCVTSAYHGGVDAPQRKPEADFTPDGWLRTGDVGRISPDGYLTLTDRAKDVIKSGGEFISSVELENALAEHPAVVEAAVVAVPDDRWGERPLAAVSLRPGSGAEPADLRDFLARRIESWMVPERWTVLSSVPKNSVGKYDKRGIQDQYARGRLDVVHLSRHPSGGTTAREPGLIGM